MEYFFFSYRFVKMVYLSSIKTNSMMGDNPREGWNYPEMNEKLKKTQKLGNHFLI